MRHEGVIEKTSKKSMSSLSELKKHVHMFFGMQISICVKVAVRLWNITEAEVARRAHGIGLLSHLS
jgi:hypothetical protein